MGVLVSEGDTETVNVGVGVCVAVLDKVGETETVGVRVGVIDMVGVFVGVCV